MRQLAPGPDAPYLPSPPAAIARLYGVDPATVAAWLADGLPQNGHGRIDPFAACNWLTWGHLDRCPVLAARWRRYLDLFRPHLAGTDSARTIVWRREHRLFPPRELRAVSWTIPGPISHEPQTVLADEGFVDGYRRPDGHLLRMTQPPTIVVRHSRCRLRIRPQPAAPDLHRVLAPLLTAFVDEFVYIYRHHRSGPQWRADIAGAWPRGSCLDGAIHLARRLRARGWACRLIAGIIARDDLANPHYWLEVAHAGAWWPLDATLPAIARMLGEDPRPWIRAYCGGCDARRVILACSDPDADERFPSPMPGTVQALTAEGELVDCWSAIDWVRGWCRGVFTTRR